MSNTTLILMLLYGIGKELENAYLYKRIIFLHAVVSTFQYIKKVLPHKKSYKHFEITTK